MILKRKVQIYSKLYIFQVFQNNEAVKVDGSAASAATNLIPGTNEILFSAAYVATADKVTAGTANASVNFSVTYE